MFKPAPWWMARILFSSFLIASPFFSQQTAPSGPAHWMLGPFVRPVDSPVIEPDPHSRFEDPISGRYVDWESLHTFNPAAIVKDGKVYLLYRAEGGSKQLGIGEYTSRLGLAESADGIHFVRSSSPVLYPEHDSQEANEVPGGVEDPRIVEAPDGTHVLTYTQWARTRKRYTVGVATSRDLHTWMKHGPIFGAYPKYGNLNYKSAGILTQRVGDRLIAAKLRGEYWMYWGEVKIHLATSRDLIHWSPVEGKDGEPLVILHDRPGLFDSAFPETGPPPVLTKDGIVLIYNAKNALQRGAPSLAPGTYSSAQALFSRADPAKLLARAEEPFLKPERPFEKTGQYQAGTTFAEGLVLFHGRLFLYYGCADSYVGVAISGPFPGHP